jgi:hypothetical protein
MFEIAFPQMRFIPFVLLVYFSDKQSPISLEGCRFGIALAYPHYSVTCSV